MMKEIAIIVATTTNNGIGYKNKIPWNVPEELNNFRMITTSSSPGMMNAVIMGRNTWESLPVKPLKNRLNIVISKTIESNAYTDYVVKCDVISALRFAYFHNRIEKIFIIGGSEIYKEILEKYVSIVDKIYLSIIHYQNFVCDKFIDMNRIYEVFNFDKENIHLTERFMFMIGKNETVSKSLIEFDENPD